MKGSLGAAEASFLGELRAIDFFFSLMSSVLHTPIFTGKSFFSFLFCFEDLILSVIRCKKRIMQTVFLKTKGSVLTE